MGEWRGRESLQAGLPSKLAHTPLAPATSGLCCCFVPGEMAVQSLTLSNLAVSFGAKVQDAYVCLSVGSQTLETSVQTTQASRLNWTEDYELCFDSSNPSSKELRIEVCSKHPARRLDPCLAKCIVPIQLGRTTSGAVRQEVSVDHAAVVCVEH